MSGELLACVMGGVYTDVEQAMQHRFISEVERLSGRRVLAFIANSHVGPDLELKLFMLAPATLDQ